jgi:Sulfotransferase family
MLDDVRAYAAFLRSIGPARAVSALAAPVNYLLGEHDPAIWIWLPNRNHLVLRSYFFAWQARGCPRLVEKTPTNIRRLPKLARTFPAGRFLYIHRHPVDVFTSYRRRAAVDPDAAGAT